MLANKASAAATAARASFEKSCGPCQKTYYSENAYNNHLNSQKHRANVAKVGFDDAASVTGSVMSSAFSLGESMASTVDSETTELDPETDKDFSGVVDGSKSTITDPSEPTSRRPAQPRSPTATHESAEDERKSPVGSSSKVQTDPLQDCLFCNYRSPNFSLNLHHMGRHHGMFVPEKEFLVEPESLIKHLHDKIHEHYECLKCHKHAHSSHGIQTHMRDRGHCMIGFETDEELVEIGEFYDFRSSYPDADRFNKMEHDMDSDDSTSTAGGGVKLGAARKTITTTEDDDAVHSGEEGDEGWETDSTVSSVPTDEITAVPIDRTHRHKLLNKSKHHAHGDPRPHKNADGFHSHAHATPVAVYHDDYELHLPTGRVAGHRSLNKYYRQNLRNYPGVAERMEAAQRRAIAGAASSDSDGDMNMEDDGRGRQQLTTRANGGLGMVGVSDSKKAEIRAVEKREQKREQRHRTNYLAGNEKRANHQKHFRDHLLQ